METQNLFTASDYINNLLLARGLLRNGKPIDFARPENAPGGTDDTMSRVINLVHDLVLRRDVCIYYFLWMICTTIKADSYPARGRAKREPGDKHQSTTKYRSETNTRNCTSQLRSAIPKSDINKIIFFLL